ncbi:hypothetical protein CHUAL_007438 [Chamberlinius hualienensis]
MGQTSGKTRPDDLYGFNRDEYKILEHNLKPLVVSHSCNHGIVDASALKNIFDKSHLSHAVIDRLCRLLQQPSKAEVQHKKPHDNNWQTLLMFLSQLLRGNNEGLSEVIVRLSSDSDQKDSIGVQQLFTFLREICRSYYVMMAETPPAISWNIQQRTESELESDAAKLVYSQIQQLIYRDKDVKETSCLPVNPLPDIKLTKEDVEKWLTNTPVMLNILETVFNIAFHLKLTSDINCEDVESYTELLPMCEKLGKKRVPPILTPSDVLILNQNLPSRLRNCWRMLFSSKLHGESLSQMLGNVMDKGPTLLVIKDHNEVVFGGFASESWTVKPQFAGTSECFLFKLHPNIGVYSSTGFNDHYMYLNLHQQTMPNGLGMGGQLEYFGLWLDSEYGKGHCSKSCTTYHSPQLSSTEEFSFHDVEVWGLGNLPKPEGDESDLRPRKSVLDKVDSGAKAILELTGRELKSEGIRQEDQEMEKEKNYNKQQ